MNNNLVFKITKFIAPICLIVIGIMALVFKNSKPIILGYVFGTLISILSLALISSSANKTVAMQSSKAQKYAFFGYFTRLIIYIIILTISHKAEYLNIFSAFIGLNMVKIAIITMTFLKKIN